MSKYDASKIQVLNSPDAVRKRPGMFLGNIDSLAANTVIYELVANSVDRYLAGLASKVKLVIVDDVATVEDDGDGLPFNKKSTANGFSSLAESFFMSLHNTATKDGHAPHVHVKGGGLGLGVVNAVCEYVHVCSSIGDKLYKQNFGKGKILSDCLVDNSSPQTKTTIKLTLDSEIFGETKFDLFDLRKTMFEVAHFYPGLVVEFQSERFYSEQGLLDLAYFYYQDPLGRMAKGNPIKFFIDGEINQIQLYIAAIGHVSDSSETRLLSWVNGAKTILGGVHEEGLRNAFSIADWNPSIAIVHAVMHKPKYAGPTKDALAGVEVSEAIMQLLEEPLSKVELPIF